MKVYIFYKKRALEYFDENPVLYAYTDDEKLSNEFKNQRNLNIFIFVKKDIPKSEYKELDKRYYKYKIRYGNFYTKSDTFGKRICVKILCTWMEEDSIIKNSERLWEEFSPKLFDCSLFKDEYLKALEKLLFIKFYGFYKVKYLEYADQFFQPYYSSFGPSEGLIMEEFKSSYSYDELKLFLRFFKDTFIEEGDNEYEKS